MNLDLFQPPTAKEDNEDYDRTAEDIAAERADVEEDFEDEEDL